MRKTFNTLIIAALTMAIIFTTSSVNNSAFAADCDTYTTGNSVQYNISCTDSCSNSSDCSNKINYKSDNILLKNQLINQIKNYLDIPTQSNCSNNFKILFEAFFNNYFSSYGTGYIPDNNNSQNTLITDSNTTQQQVNTPNNSYINDGKVDAVVLEVVKLVNEERAKEGIRPLEIDINMCAAAQIRAQEATQSFSHTRPDGSSCFSALAETNVHYNTAGENIAIGQRTAKEVVEDWMNSPGHKANIMNSIYSRIGVAYTPSTGAYSGYAWAQFFAN